MKVTRLLSIMALTMILGFAVMLFLSPIAPVRADDDPPRSRANSPEAFIFLYVDRTDDANVSTCNDGAANDCTLRGAINKANGDPANTYTINFTPTVAVVNLANPLPILTANELWIIGASGVPKIDALSMTNGNVFTRQCQPGHHLGPVHRQCQWGDSSC